MRRVEEEKKEPKDMSEKELQAVVDEGKDEDMVEACKKELKARKEKKERVIVTVEKDVKVNDDIILEAGDRFEVLSKE